MAKVAAISNPNNLPLIHDCWFNLDEVNFDAFTGVLEVPFMRPILERSRTVKRIFLKRVQVPLVRCVLRMRYVECLKLEDTKCVGSYDFDEMRYDSAAQKIVVDTGVLLRFEVKFEVK